MFQWRPIAGWPEYEISSEGTLRRIFFSARQTRRITIRGWIGRNGYRAVTLWVLARRRRENIHVLVCETFHGPKPSPRHEVGHRNGNRLDNRQANLRWVTRKVNCDDSATHGTKLQGERQNGAKLTAEAVIIIRARNQDGEKQAALAVEFAVGTGCISKICRRETWKHI